MSQAVRSCWLVKRHSARWVPMLDGLDLILRWYLDEIRPRTGGGRALFCDEVTGLITRAYSITCTNIPDSGIEGVSGSHHSQYAGTPGTQRTTRPEGQRTRSQKTDSRRSVTRPQDS